MWQVRDLQWQRLRSTIGSMNVPECDRASVIYEADGSVVGIYRVQLMRGGLWHVRRLHMTGEEWLGHTPVEADARKIAQENFVTNVRLLFLTEVSTPTTMPHENSSMPQQPNAVSESDVGARQ